MFPLVLRPDDEPDCHLTWTVGQTGVKQVRTSRQQFVRNVSRVVSQKSNKRRSVDFFVEMSTLSGPGTTPKVECKSLCDKKRENTFLFIFYDQVFPRLVLWEGLNAYSLVPNVTHVWLIWHMWFNKPM